MDTKDDFEIGQSSTSIASAPTEEAAEESGSGRIVDDPINEIPFIAADTRSDCCSDSSEPKEQERGFFFHDSII